MKTFYSKTTTLPFFNMDSLFNEFDKLFSTFDESMKDSFYVSTDTDIIKSENEDILHISLPGYKKEDVKINVDENNILKILAKRETPSQKYQFESIKKGEINLSFKLGKEHDHEKIDAKFENGILEIKIPKIKIEAKSQKEIKIN